MRSARLFSIAAILMTACIAYAQLDRPVRLGEKMPPLSLVYVKGQPIDTRPNQNTITIVEFWATWCEPCIYTIPHLTEMYHRYGHRGLQVVGISSEPVDTIESFVNQMDEKMDYTVAADRNARTTARFRDPEGQIPAAYLFNEEGTLIWIGHPAHPDLEELVHELLDELNPH